MSLPAPILIVSDRSDRALAKALADAIAAQPAESSLREAAAATARIRPAAIVFLGSGPVPRRLQGELMDAIDALPAPFVPVMKRVAACGACSLDALPLDVSASCAQVAARLAAMLRVRELHGTVLARTEALRRRGSCRAAAASLPDTDPLDEATVLVMGRGRHVPALMAAAGACAGVVGALSVETAAHYLNVRDIDGIIIADGFATTTLDAFLTALAQDCRFGDLPVGIVPALPASVDRVGLCGVEPVRGSERDIVEHMMPLVRVHAFAARLRRHAGALDAAGLIDAHTGLFTLSAFGLGLPQVMADCRRRNVPMSVARFDLLGALSARARADAGRMVRRLIGAMDFASQDADGAITVVMAGEALHRCHVIARRIASTLRNAMLNERDSTAPIEAMVTIAALRPTDSPSSLLARVSGPAARVAAE